MDSRDPQLRAFEQYLLSHMRASDVTTDSEGVYLSVMKSSKMAHFVFKCNKEDYLSVCDGRYWL
jgi:hypothetical protein